MEYTKRLKNAYPHIILHDCNITGIKYNSGLVSFCFRDGFFLDSETRTKGGSMLSMQATKEDVEFIISKEFRLFGGFEPFYLTRYKTIEDIEKMLGKGKVFTVINEYYRKNKLLWKGVISVCQKKNLKNWGWFELSVTSNEQINLIYDYFA